MTKESLQVSIKKILHNTPTKELSISRYDVTVESSLVLCDYKRCHDLCSSGCVNFNKKYSCPPFSPDFFELFNKDRLITIICYQLDLKQYAPLHHYQRIKASNSVLKSILDKELYELKKSGLRVAGSGSCRACKPCGAKENLPCKKPHKRIYSLESMGVDVDDLVRRCFGFSLEWYQKKTPKPEITCVVGAVEFQKE